MYNYTEIMYNYAKTTYGKPIDKLHKNIIIFYALLTKYKNIVEKRRNTPKIVEYIIVKGANKFLIFAHNNIIIIEGK